MKNRNGSFLKILIHITALIICGLLFVPTTLAVVDRAPPFVYLSNSIEPTTVEKGGKLIVRWEGEVLKAPCEGIVHRSIVDSSGRVYIYEAKPSVLSNQSKAVKKVSFSREMVLPDDIAVGEAKYIAKPEYWCNPAQQFVPIKVDVPVGTFTVVSKPS